MATDPLIREIQRATPFDINGIGQSGIDVAVMQWIGAAGQLAPAYYSQARDVWLRNFVLKSDHLKITVNTFIEKVLAIPLDITPRDATVKAHVALARQIQDDIQRNSGMLKGFQNELSKFINDYLTTDNGGFMMLLGPGKPDGPIVGQVIALLHLDSCRCFRTGNVEYPVRYEHIDGKSYKIHYTRIIFMSSMPSTDSSLCDVGLCAVSRSIDAAQELLDMAVYSQEKLGSRPPRQILYAKKGATLQQLVKAVEHAEGKMDAQGLTRFARTLLLAPQVVSGELELDLIDLAKVPDNFNRMDVTMLDMAVLAAAFGLDMRDLAFSFGLAGQTKADAEVQHLKTKGKGAAQFMRDFAIQYQEKVLPESLQAEFDYVDDTQDAQAATMDKTRAEARTIDLTSGATTITIARQKMVDDGELSPEQFEQLELEDGRLADGMDVLTLFMSTDPEISRVLNLGVDDPTNVEANDATTILVSIDAQSKAAWQRYDTAPNVNIRSKMRRALAALDALKELYQPTDQPQVTPQPAPDSTQQTGQQPMDGNQQPVAKERTLITPINANTPLPAIPSEEDIAAEAERFEQSAIDSFYDANPEYHGLLDAEVATGKKKEVKQADRYSYDSSTYRYRDKQTGRFVSDDTLRSLVGQYQEARHEIARSVASRLANGKMSPAQMVDTMRGALRDTYTAAYMAARGGRNAMTQSDWGQLGQMLKKQYGYLNDFAAEVAAGQLSEAQIAARATLYFNSATQAYFRGITALHDGLDLPAQPGDGSTPCRTNCKCRWIITETPTEWRALWRLGDAEHCSVCVERAGTWNPLIVKR